jgi:pyruvate formate lyase activating enzyme
MILDRYNSDSKGYVFDIQGLSVHDGPGCRTLIFLNGCSMNCFWCSNPEGISEKPSVLYFSSKCIVCGNCVDNCPHKAIRIENNKLKISRQICTACERPGCIDECHTDALKSGGYEISVSRLFEIIQRDRQFWGSKGGITLTGGEPLVQINFAEEILLKCHEAYIHTAIETCGNVPWESFQKIVSNTDWIFFDLKNFDSKEHKKATNSGNSLILENARQLSDEFTGRLIFRLPLIPGFNDSKDNVDSIITFMKETGRDEINILPLHHLGIGKYQLLNKKYPGSDYPIPTNEILGNIGKIFKASNIECYVGSETPY